MATGTGEGDGTTTMATTNNNNNNNCNPLKKKTMLFVVNVGGNDMYI